MMGALCPPIGGIRPLGALPRASQRHTVALPSLLVSRGARLQWSYIFITFSLCLHTMHCSNLYPNNKLNKHNVRLLRTGQARAGGRSTGDASPKKWVRPKRKDLPYLVPRQYRPGKQMLASLELLFAQTPWPSKASVRSFWMLHRMPQHQVGRGELSAACIKMEHRVRGCSRELQLWHISLAGAGLAVVCGAATAEWDAGQTEWRQAPEGAFIRVASGAGDRER